MQGLYNHRIHHHQSSLFTRYAVKCTKYVIRIPNRTYKGMKKGAKYVAKKTKKAFHKITRRSNSNQEITQPVEKPIRNAYQNKEPVDSVPINSSSAVYFASVQAEVEKRRKETSFVQKQTALSPKSQKNNLCMYLTEIIYTIKSSNSATSDVFVPVLLLYHLKSNGSILSARIKEIEEAYHEIARGESRIKYETIQTEEARKILYEKIAPNELITRWMEYSPEFRAKYESLITATDKSIETEKEPHLRNKLGINLYAAVLEEVRALVISQLQRMKMVERKPVEKEELPEKEEVPEKEKSDKKEEESAKEEEPTKEEDGPAKKEESTAEITEQPKKEESSTKDEPTDKVVVIVNEIVNPPAEGQKPVSESVVTEDLVGNVVVVNNSELIEKEKKESVKEESVKEESVEKTPEKTVKFSIADLLRIEKVTTKPAEPVKEAEPAKPVEEIEKNESVDNSVKEEEPTKDKPVEEVADKSVSTNDLVKMEKTVEEIIKEEIEKTIKAAETVETVELVSELSVPSAPVELVSELSPNPMRLLMDSVVEDIAINNEEKDEDKELTIAAIEDVIVAISKKANSSVKSVPPPPVKQLETEETESKFIQPAMASQIASEIARKLASKEDKVEIERESASPNSPTMQISPTTLTPEELRRRQRALKVEGASRNTNKKDEVSKQTLRYVARKLNAKKKK